MALAAWPFGVVFGDSVASHQSVALLCALHTNAIYAYESDGGIHEGHRLPRNAAEQIAGVCAAVFDHDIAKSPSGFLKLPGHDAMDVCGMGGDKVVTPNVSTAAALVATVAGARLCKHGSPANADKGRHGSSDFISMLGINTLATAKDAAECLRDLGFVYTEALDEQYKLIHKQTHGIANMPHMNDLIGPITNPFDPHMLTKRVLGINDLMPPRLVAEAYKILNERGYTNLQRGLFVRGYATPGSEEGMDELSICPGGTDVAELRDGVITEYHLNAEDFGLQPVPVESISPPQGVSKGDFTLSIIKGEIDGPAADMISANAALLLCLDRGISLHDKAGVKVCFDEASSILKSGAAHDLSQRVADRLPKYVMFDLFI
ncbi:MAG: hypothetical protein AB7G06_09405 [Bdellovibrionales bacterium]